jgi:hypothetical protein
VVGHKTLDLDAKKMKKDQEEEEYVIVSIKDSGIGIDP